MALTEAEELELLELEEEEAMGISKTSDAPGKGGVGHAAQAGVAALKALAKTATAPISAPMDAAKVMTDPANRKAVGPWLPAIGAVTGSAIFPGLGTAVGAGLGSIAQQAGQVVDDPANAPQGPWQAAKSAMLQTGLAGVPEASAVLKAAPGALSYGQRATNKVVDKLGNAAISSGRRALGYTKAFINKKAGNLAVANKVAKTMLDEDVIKPFSGAGAMATRAEALAEKSGNTIGQTYGILDDAGQKSIDTNSVIANVVKQLEPKYTGGAYDAERKVFDEVIDTIRAHGSGPIDFASASALKQKLQELGKFELGGDNVKRDLYRRASGIARQALDEAVDKGLSNAGLSPQIGENYQRAKRGYGAAESAAEALRNRGSSEQGNRIVSLTDFIAGSGAATTGQVPLSELPGKLGLMFAAKRAVERYGTSTAAWTFKKAADLIDKNGEVVNVARRALITRFITSDGD